MRYHPHPDNPDMISDLIADMIAGWLGKEGGLKYAIRKFHGTTGDEFVTLMKTSFANHCRSELRKLRSKKRSPRPHDPKGQPQKILSLDEPIARDAETTGLVRMETVADSTALNPESELTVQQCKRLITQLYVEERERCRSESEVTCLTQMFRVGLRGALRDEDLEDTLGLGEPPKSRGSDEKTEVVPDPTNWVELAAQLGSGSPTPRALSQRWYRTKKKIMERLQDLGEEG